MVRGRIVRAAFAESAPPPKNHAGARRIAAEEVLAHERADAIIARAKESAAKVAEEAAAEAKQAEHAKLAAQYLVLHARDEQRADRDLERAIKLAVLLAERLLGAAIEQDPAKIAALARQALAEARGARRAKIEAHPLDAEALRKDVAQLGLPEGSVEVTIDTELARGSLMLHTDLGILDAKLIVQLERLAAALRDAIARP